MRKFAVPLAIAALVGVFWLVWNRPSEESGTEAEAPTDVAVRVATVTRATLRAYVTAYGTVTPEPAGQNPAASARVAPSAAGVVVAIECVEGQRVSEGDLLFQLDSRAANVAVGLAENTVARERRLIQIEGTSQRALDNAEYQLDAARTQQALLQVRSPLTGTVTHVAVNPGEAVDLTTVMAEIVDLDRLIVSARVPSAELPALEIGQAAEIVQEGGATVIMGALTYISPAIDARTGTAEVRVSIPIGTGLRPGEFVMIRITSGEIENTLVVPIESLVRNEAGQNVVAIVNGDSARQIPVRPGLRDGGLVEVVAAELEEGMTVVTEGAYALPSETRVHVIGN